MYLSELRQRFEADWGVTVHESTISRSLHHVGYSMKKVSVSAFKQNEDIHCQYLLCVGFGFSVEQLVFVNESACNRITTRQWCAWAPVGNCTRRHNYFVHGKW